jgi:hypothetical protein
MWTLIKMVKLTLMSELDFEPKLKQMGIQTRKSLTTCAKFRIINLGQEELTVSRLEESIHQKISFVINLIKVS